MTAEDLVLRLGSTILAALGGWLGGILWLPLFRVRDATLRAVCWTLAAVPPLLVVAGLPAGGFFSFRVFVPPDWFLFRSPAAAPAMLLLWAVVAAWLVERHAARDARMTACLEGLAATSPVPDDLAESVRRTARWMGVTAPRVAAAEGDGTAFVTGTRSPVLFVPLALWTRLDLAGRRALLLHEMAHVRRGDPLRLRVLSIVLDFLWPAFPLRWTAARIRDAWEAQADEEAVHGGATRSALARSLVEAWNGPQPPGVLAFGGAGAAMARRLAALRRRPRAIRLTLQILALLWCFPWCPGWDGWTVDMRMARPTDEGRRGVVAIGFGGHNPIVAAVERRELEAWNERRAKKGRAPER